MLGDDDDPSNPKDPPDDPTPFPNGSPAARVLLQWFDVIVDEVPAETGVTLVLVAAAVPNGARCDGAGNCGEGVIAMRAAEDEVVCRLPLVEPSNEDAGNDEESPAAAPPAACSPRSGRGIGVPAGAAPAVTVEPAPPVAVPQGSPTLGAVIIPCPAFTGVRLPGGVPPAAPPSCLLAAMNPRKSSWAVVAAFGAKELLV